MNQHNLSLDKTEPIVAGPQGTISSRTTVKDWLNANQNSAPMFDRSRPVAFGCSICQILRFETLEEATQHTKDENRTVRSKQWKHFVTIVAERVIGYEIAAEEILKAAEKQQSELARKSGMTDDQIETGEIQF